MEDRHVGVSFSGGALASLGYTVLLVALGLFVVPAAWGAAAFLAWWTGRLVFTDGTRAVFEGRPGRVWPLFAALVFLALLPTLITAGMPHGGKTSALQCVLALALIPFEAALKLPIYRWIFENIRLEPGGTPRFSATYPAYLGWVLGLTLSVLTVIGWAWVAVAMVRWFCRHIEGDGYGLAFVGTGWGLLWRSGLWLLGTLFLLPIPWVLRSMYAWLTDNIEIIRRDQQGEFGSFAA